jgi:AcrR family transcriptional regulator
MSESAGPAEATGTSDARGASPATRLDRRKARTRRALLDAARAIAAERDTGDVSIQEITDRADVGFGSFYNHFATKAELFDAAVAEVLEEHGRLLDRASEGVEDPAEVFAIGLRTTARLAEDHPVIAQVLVRAGLSYLTSSGGLAPRAARDIERAVAAGRFDLSAPFLGVVTTTGCLLAYLHVRLQSPERLGHESVDELVERLLRMMGMSPADAREIAARPLPAGLEG